MGILRWFLVDSYLERASRVGKFKGIKAAWVRLSEGNGGIAALELRGAFTALSAHHLQHPDDPPRDSNLRFEKRLLNYQNPSLPSLDFQNEADSDPTLINLMLVHGDKRAEFAFLRIYNNPQNLRAYMAVSENLMNILTLIPPIEVEPISEPTIDLKPHLKKDARRYCRNMNRVCPERITQARELAGISKTALAELLDVSPAAVAQWESGTKQPTAENVAALAQKLDVAMTLLLKVKPVELRRGGPVTFRAWSSANTRRANRKAERLTELVSEVFLWLGERIKFPHFTPPEIPNPADIEDAALHCRRAWGLGDRPITKLGELLESKGIFLSKASFNDNRFDAFSCIINGRPFIFLGDEKGDNARSRFDAAHELGHLVLHQHLTDCDLQQSDVLARVEKEANRFGGAFLLPSETFAKDVLDVTLDSFLKLKPKWGVSAQAMVMRAYQLGLIREEQYRELFRQISVRGWRKAKGEPFDEMIPLVRSSIGKKSLEMLESNGIIHAWEIPSELPVPIKILSEIFHSDLGAFEPAHSLKIIPFESYLKKNSVVQDSEDKTSA